MDVHFTHKFAITMKADRIATTRIVIRVEIIALTNNVMHTTERIGALAVDSSLTSLNIADVHLSVG